MKYQEYTTQRTPGRKGFNVPVALALSGLADAPAFAVRLTQGSLLLTRRDMTVSDMVRAYAMLSDLSGRLIDSLVELSVQAAEADGDPDDDPLDKLDEALLDELEELDVDLEGLRLLLEAEGKANG